MAKRDPKKAKVGNRKEAPAAPSFRSEVSGFTLPKDGRGTGGYGDRIRDRKVGIPGYGVPRYVYLIYISLNSEYNLIIRQVEAPLQGSLDQTEKALFDAAKSPTGTYKTNFQDMVWSKRCYVIMVLDIPRWRFYQEKDLDHSAIRFHRRKDIIGKETKIYKENYAFYNGERGGFTDNSGKDYGAFRCTNYVKDEFGDLIKGQELDYCFEIFIEAPVGPGEEYITILIDPDGQNRGPPAKTKRSRKRR